MVNSTALVLALLWGCRDPEALKVEVDDNVGTVLTVEWTSPIAGTAHIEYELDGVVGTTPESTVSGTEHEVLVLGLKAGQTYQLTGVVTGADGGVDQTEPVEIKLDPAPEDLPRFTLTTEGGDDLLPGYVLASTLGPRMGWLVILDMDGDPVWYHQADEGLSITSSRPSSDGKSILHSQYDVEQRTDSGGFVRVPIAGGEAALTRTELAHHDFVELPDGQVAWIALDIRDADVEGETISVAGDKVLVGQEGESEAQASEIFSYWDFFDPWIDCSHFEAEAYTTGAIDWVHANSLMYDEAEDAVYIMSKNHDSLIKVDRSSGERVWQIGGRDATLAFAEGSEGWSHGHMSQIWSDGFTVFDNGYHNGGYSRAVEYAIDEGSGTVEKTFEFVMEGRPFVQLLGDVRKLPDASYLMSWTSLGVINRANAAGELTWQVEAGIGNATGRVVFIEDLYTLDQP